ncbi:MAG: hypothetical protein EOQ86_16730 [Mesorhizobium sp.]|uniref:hypothetical protein n=2 Tax=Mesorhizobium sp. TaxID=1871066 RepID=UPI000FE4C8D2|nr:hypothetical protein [Mesorhizobium sp.]RWH78821.1 MAG: hypothetical protein EOQ85_14665 [Mesorhizobium sp.]RWH81507.1 MAG: hypothetical protein EOQ86_16730 [Mesorhizobium sp.]RWI00282.1 MAG: hypothetical protein EOQ89_18930 [Mesorhizobium sp.]RWI07793.1 MAG: hypothetical protein EOQ90_21885 [Mesorhizobium sp.]RWI18810.1 MAG: hypothetical protein EOQ91_14815 [Mesorhizobium sp.]
MSSNYSMSSASGARRQFAYLAEPDTGKYRGSAFITLGRDMKDRLWKCVQDHAGPRPEVMKEKPEA